jgi:hypothetical protein
MKNSFKVLEQVGHQGDTQWYSIDKIPKDAKKVEKQFIAASERSGSFHALSGNYDQYEVDGGFVIDVKEDCVLNHSLKEHLKENSLNDNKILPKKDHRHSDIKKGLYYVGIQNKFDPLSAQKGKVKD